MISEFFNKKPLTSFDWLSVLCYLLVTILVANIEGFSFLLETKKNIILGYSFTTPLFLYIFCYKSLRNIKMTVIWISFSIYHLFLHQILTSNQKLSYLLDHPAKGLKYTVYMIILFQTLRILHIIIMKKELVSTASGGSKMDFWDNRKILVTDIICLSIYFTIWLLMMVS